MAYGIVAANDPGNKIDPTGRFMSMGSVLVGISLGGILIGIATFLNRIKASCSNITIKRNDISWSILPPFVTGFGHWWLEMGAESYGWYPDRKFYLNVEGLMQVITGVGGLLNGKGVYNEGTSTRDPDHGWPADKKFNPKVFRFNSCDKAATCYKAFAQSYQGDWEWPLGPNCHTFQQEGMKQCGLLEK